MLITLTIRRAQEYSKTSYTLHDSTIQIQFLIQNIIYLAPSLQILNWMTFDHILQSSFRR